MLRNKIETCLLAAGLSVALGAATAAAETHEPGEPGVNCRVQSALSIQIPPGNRPVTAEVLCDAGLVLTGGGETCGQTPEVTGLDLPSTAYPAGDPAEWYCSWENTSFVTASCRCDAICCTMTPEAPPVAQGCVHDECSAGGALDDSCNLCVADVCACDPFCCANGWDAFCIHEAQELCGKSCGSVASCLAGCGCP